LTTALGLAIRECTTEATTIATDWAGVIPYFSHRRTLDLLGKSDPLVARQPMHLDMALPLKDRFWPGHLKWDFGHSIVDQRSEMLIVLTGGYLAKVDAYASARYTHAATALFGGVLVAKRETQLGDCVDARVRVDIPAPDWQRVVSDGGDE
jgi:hypothetical protein